MQPWRSEETDKLDWRKMPNSKCVCEDEWVCVLCVFQKAWMSEIEKAVSSLLKQDSLHPRVNNSFHYTESSQIWFTVHTDFQEKIPRVPMDTAVHKNISTFSPKNHYFFHFSKVYQTADTIYRVWAGQKSPSKYQVYLCDIVRLSSGQQWWISQQQFPPLIQFN